MQLLEKIIISSVLILAVLIIRTLFRKKVSPVFIYSLWLLAAVRILWPGMIGESPLSIMNTGLWKTGEKAILKENGRQNREYKERKYQKYLEEITEKQRLEQLQEDAGSEEIPPKEPETGEIVLPFPAGPSPKLFGRLEFWAVRFWIVGMAVIGAVFLRRNLSLYRYLRRTRKKLREVSTGIGTGIGTGFGAGKRRISVFTAGDKLPSPCLFGLLPSIYIPERCVAGEKSREKDERLDFILNHEMTHYRHFDPVWSLVRMLCLITAWYNPLVWIAAGLSVRDGELACDWGCVKRLDREKRIAYGEALLSMVDSTGERSGLLLNATMMTAGGKFMKKRMEGIVENRKISGIAVLAVAALMVLCAGAVFTGSVAGETQENGGTEGRTANTAW